MTGDGLFARFRTDFYHSYYLPGKAYLELLSDYAPLMVKLDDRWGQAQHSQVNDFLTPSIPWLPMITQHLNG
jgi:hypothetical protein